MVEIRKATLRCFQEVYGTCLVRVHHEKRWTGRNTIGMSLYSSETAGKYDFLNLGMGLMAKEVFSLSERCVVATLHMPEKHTGAFSSSVITTTVFMILSFLK